MSVKLNESTGSLVDRTTESKSGKRWRVKVIEAGQGSSAFYPERVLEDYASVFTAGTKMYLDHPLASEAESRPERSLRDLVGKLATDAEYEDGALYAEAEFYPHVSDIVEAMSEDIGLSIRAYGTAQESKTGPILTSFTGVESVDLVTTPGAGGRFIEAIESARPVNEAKSNDRRDQLSKLLDTEAADDYKWTWVRDVDDSKKTVWYELDNTTYQRTYNVVNDVASSLNDDAIEVVATTEYVSVPTAVSETTTKEKRMDEAQEAKLDQMIESMTGLTEALKTLTEGAKPVPKVEEEEGRTTAIDPLEAAAALAGSELSEAGQKQVMAQVKAGAALEEAITAQKEYEDSLRETVEGGFVADESSKPVAVPFKKFGA